MKRFVQSCGVDGMFNLNKNVRIVINIFLSLRYGKTLKRRRGNKKGFWGQEKERGSPVLSQGRGRGPNWGAQKEGEEGKLFTGSPPRAIHPHIPGFSLARCKNRHTCWWIMMTKWMRGGCWWSRRSGMPRSISRSFFKISRTWKHSWLFAETPSTWE